MPQMINNLELELKRHRLNLEFIRMIDLDSQSNSPMDIKPVQEDSQEKHGLTGTEQIAIAMVGQGAKNPLVRASSLSASPDKHHLDLEDTEHPDLKIGLQKNGRKYSVRTNRKRFFFPDEWNKFWNALETESQRICYDTLINTGARYNEAKHIKKEDIDFDRGILTIKVAKIKAKKGERFPNPRTFKLSSQFLARLKIYFKDLNDGDTLPFITNSALNLALKKIVEKVGIKDYYNFSVHNLRKTNGNWLKATGVIGDDIVDRLGHDHETFRKSYSSATIFNREDRVLIRGILGDIIDYYLNTKGEILGEMGK